MVSAFLFDASFHRKPRRVDLVGIVLMVVGFGCLQLMLDLGERRDWFDSNLILALSVLAVCTLLGFVLRELIAAEPILDLTVFADRNFAVGSLAILLVALGFNSSLLLVALYTQQVLGYDAWSSGLTLAPGGVGTLIALMISGRLVSRMDQRLMLAGGMLVGQGLALYLMTQRHVDDGLLEPRLAALRPGLLPGLHLRAAAGAHARHRHDGAPRQCDGRLQRRCAISGAAWAWPLATTLLARRSQHHQVTLVRATSIRGVPRWTSGCAMDGPLRRARAPTPSRRAGARWPWCTARRSRRRISWPMPTSSGCMLAVYVAVLFLIPFMRRVRSGQGRGRRVGDESESGARDPGLPAPAE